MSKFFTSIYIFTPSSHDTILHKVFFYHLNLISKQDHSKGLAIKKANVFEVFHHFINQERWAMQLGHFILMPPSFDEVSFIYWKWQMKYFIQMLDSHGK